ncbi:MAG: autotransporter outer membrane beta-barrel domain-containing protein [Gammaproteobacteria bacterium]|nr:MAG: autotransporter outer membrane beta-barrel domain-containing protein [Gammaproteobacteria bacterium]
MANPIQSLIISDCFSAGTYMTTECPGDAPGSRNTSVDNQRVSVGNTAGQTADHVNSTLRPGSGGRPLGGLDGDPDLAGRSAGELFDSYGLWASYSHTFTDTKDLIIRSTSDLDNVLVGIDLMPRENLLAGVAFGFEHSDIDTVFNDGTQQIDGYSVIPYLGYVINDTWSIDASAGYTSIDARQTRNIGPNIDGDYDADRWFVAANLNGFWQIDHWLLGAHLGYLYSNEDQDGFAEVNAATGAIVNNIASNDIDLGQLRAGFNIAYDYQSFLEPFFSAAYLLDTTRDDIVIRTAALAGPANDDDEFQLTAGARYFGNDGVSASLGWTVSADRENFNSHFLSLSVRIPF